MAGRMDGDLDVSENSMEPPEVLVLQPAGRAEFITGDDEGVASLFPQGGGDAELAGGVGILSVTDENPIQPDVKSGGHPVESQGHVGRSLFHRPEQAGGEGEGLPVKADVVPFHGDGRGQAILMAVPGILLIDVLGPQQAVHLQAGGDGDGFHATEIESGERAGWCGIHGRVYLLGAVDGHLPLAGEALNQEGRQACRQVCAIAGERPYPGIVPSGVKMIGMRWKTVDRIGFRVGQPGTARCRSGWNMHDVGCPFWTDVVVCRFGAQPQVLVMIYFPQ